MKIGLWTDSHYSTAVCTCEKRYNSASLDKIRRALAYFQDNRCDIAICLGDLIDKEDNHEQERDNLRQVADVMNAFGLPVISLMGNHDAFSFTPEEFYALLGTERRPRLLQSGGKNLLFIDACHFKTGVHYAPGDTDWTDTYYPYAQALRETLQSLTGDTYVFMHQNIDENIPENHRLANDAEIRGILTSSGSVKAVYQGHYHPGFSSTAAGIQYVTLPAMCENDGALYILEI